MLFTYCYQAVKFDNSRSVVNWCCLAGKVITESNGWLQLGSWLSSMEQYDNLLHH